MSAAGSAADLSLPQLALALLLVGVVIVISMRQGLGIGGDLVVGSLRAVVQLYLVGFILALVFHAARWYWVLLILAVMTAVAAEAATSRLAKPIPGGRVIAALALTLSTAVTLVYVIGVIVRVRPWYDPQYIIPIAGMILGSAMTSAALAGDRLQGDLRARADEVEARLALGFSGREAVQPMTRMALRAATGASPLLAIKYQLVVIFMQAAATALAALLFVRLTVGRYLTSAHQFRRSLL